MISLTEMIAIAHGAWQKIVCEVLKLNQIAFSFSLFDISFDQFIFVSHAVLFAAWDCYLLDARLTILYV